MKNYFFVILVTVFSVYAQTPTPGLPTGKPPSGNKSVTFATEKAVGRCEVAGHGTAPPASYPCPDTNYWCSNAAFTCVNYYCGSVENNWCCYD